MRSFLLFVGAFFLSFLQSESRVYAYSASCFSCGSKNKVEVMDRDTTHVYIAPRRRQFLENVPVNVDGGLLNQVIPRASSSVGGGDPLTQLRNIKSLIKKKALAIRDLQSLYLNEVNSNPDPELSSVASLISENLAPFFEVSFHAVCIFKNPESPKLSEVFCDFFKIASNPLEVQQSKRTTLIRNLDFILQASKWDDLEVAFRPADFQVYKFDPLELAARPLYPTLIPLKAMNRIPGFIVILSEKEVNHSNLALNLETLFATYAMVLQDSNIRKCYFQMTQGLKDIEKRELEAKLTDQMVANVSHDLRTPLNGIVGASTLLMNDLESPINESSRDHLKDLARVIIDTSSHLNLVINDILDIAKIRSGNLALASEPFLLQEVVSQVISNLNFQAAKKNIQLIFNMDSKDAVWVLGDRSRFAQILYNLIGNAVKFTQVGGVRVDTQFVPLIQDRVDRVLVKFQIQDSGPGMTEAELSKLFTPFSQGKLGIQQGANGTGLGLAIVKELINKMGGGIHIQSKLGRGTEVFFEVFFEVTLPEVRPQVGEPLSNENPEVFNRSHNLKVLIADDNRVNQKVLAKMLPKDFTVHFADDGVEAVHKVTEAFAEGQPYQMVFMDGSMPNMDGIQATQAIKKLKEYSAMKPIIIAVTANALEGSRQEYLDKGLDDYISKPIIKGILDSKIKVWTKQLEEKAVIEGH